MGYCETVMPTDVGASSECVKHDMRASTTEHSCELFTYLVMVSFCVTLDMFNNLG